MGVYPRVCGGTRPSCPEPAARQGLSPRVRGNHQANQCAASSGGSIPACAGEPPPPTRRSPSIRVYPRVCGEPTSSMSRTISHRVYPRVCGGTAKRGASCPPPRGLSPRVRGNRGRGGAAPVDRGSIPACAGEPLGFGRGRRLHGVYPRVCGGTATTASTEAVHMGLSPRVRGNRDHGQHRGCPYGSIPACAGEPRPRLRCWWPSWVYPRVCGGTALLMGREGAKRGLSPRVRGNPTPPAPARPAAGSIPACAGEPDAPDRAVAGARVYPRVCGGTSLRQ